MHTILINRCKYDILYRIDDGNFYVLAPYGNVKVTCQNSGHMKLSVKHNYESDSEKHWWGRDYHLVIDSEYLFNYLSEGDEIQILREKTCLEPNAVYYDRFFTCCKTAPLVFESHRISGAEKMIKLHKSEMKWYYMLDCLGELKIGELSGIGLLGLLIGIFLDWKSALYYFLGCFVLIIIILMLSRLTWNLFDKKEPDKFPGYLTNDYIIRYYSNPDRIPHFDE